MGCVISREVSSGIVSEAKEKSLSAQSNRKVDDLSARKVERNVVGAHNGGIKEDKDGGDGGQKSPGERKRSKANPRSGNLSKHPRGEKVVVEWPPWLTNACGKALDGWIPRRVDTFRKIDKVGTFLFFCGKWKMLIWDFWMPLLNDFSLAILQLIAINDVYFVLERGKCDDVSCSDVFLFSFF